MIPFNLPYGAIGVVCADENCELPSTMHDRHTLLCKKHYAEMQDLVKHGKPAPFVFEPHTTICFIQSPRKMKLTEKQQIIKILETAHLIGIPGLTPQEITLIGGLEEKDYAYRRRCSDLKNENVVSVVGYRFDGKRLNEILALNKYIPREYFSSTIIDKNIIDDNNPNYTRCGACGAFDLGSRGNEEIINLVNSIRQKTKDPEIMRLFKLLFPKNHMPQNMISDLNKLNN